MAELVFILSVAVIAYTYAGYPIMLRLLSSLFGRPTRQADITPAVSIIIAAYNEEDAIAAKIENTLSLDYPVEKLQIIVTSDCSTDRTDDIVRSYASRGVLLHRQPDRLGKTSAQNSAVKVATGEILFFSDATTIYKPDTLSKIVRNFADTQVGAVTGSVVYVDPATTSVGAGCRSYWSYEFFLKESESRLSSLIGVCGCLYAVRRSSYVRLAQDMNSDFVTAIEVHLQGLRTVYEPEAISIEDTNLRGREEFRMRVRVIERTMNALHRYREVLSIGRHGLFAFQMISHKVMRYAVSIFLISAFASNYLLLNRSEIFHLTFLLQAALYSAAVLGWAADRLGLSIGPLSIPYYFTLGNLAALVAFVKFMRGETNVVWRPIREAAASGQTDGSR